VFWPPWKGTIAVSVGKAIDPARFANMSREQTLEELFRAIEAVQQRAEKLRRQ
jgi:hypothetical protein